MRTKGGYKSSPMVADRDEKAVLEVVRAGIMAVTARLESGRLRVLAGACPNLLYEAALYRYGESSPSRGSEAPLDQHNHALAALRYLISRLDEGRQARRRHIPAPAPSPTPPSPPLQEHWTRRWNDPDLWTRLF